MKKQRFLSALGRFFKDLVTKNVTMKILALVFAILLWGYVLTVENPEYEKTVQDVDISILGADSLNSKGLMLLTRELGTTDVSVLLEVSKHSELDASRINCSVNLQNKNFVLAENEDSKVFTVDVSTTIASGYGTITNVSRNSVEIEVARISSRTRIPVTVNVVGDLPQGFVWDVADSLNVSLEGRKSLLDKIARASITIDFDQFQTNDPYTLADTFTSVYEVEFFDAGNVRLEGITSSSGEPITMEVSMTIYYTKEVPIVPQFVLSDEEAFTLEYLMTKDSVVLYGDFRTLEQTEAIYPTEQIPISSVDDSNNYPLSLQLPDGTKWENGFSGRITLSLTVREKELTEEVVVPLLVDSLGANVQRGEPFPTEVTLILTGTRAELDAFRLTDVTAYVDLSGYGAGTHTVPLLLTVKNGVSLTVTAKEPNVTLTLIA